MRDPVATSRCCTVCRNPTLDSGQLPGRALRGAPRGDTRSRPQPTPRPTHVQRAPPGWRASARAGRSGHRRRSPASHAAPPPRWEATGRGFSGCGVGLRVRINKVWCRAWGSGMVNQALIRVWLVEVMVQHHTQLLPPRWETTGVPGSNKQKEASSVRSGSVVGVVLAPHTAPLHLAAKRRGYRVQQC